MSENSLVVRLKSGDQKALELIYSEYRISFISFITTSHNCSKEEAIDLYQYAILVFYENVVDGSFEEMNAAGLKTYLFSIGKNKLLGDLRKKTKISFQGGFKENDLIEDEDVSELIRVEQFDKIKNVIADLGDPCKRILELFYFNKLPNEKIAEIMGYSSAKTVKNLKYKCLQRIKKLIE
jgi:RNA polymerase sigma-70 factor (ECF subfamily)